jgi:formylglycine-generating enzyme required for sulfatase activity
MGGNAGEWVSDYYQPYEGSKASDPRFGTEYRVTRGGYLMYTNEQIDLARTTYRRPEKPDDPSVVRAIGFRCVVEADDPGIQELLRGRNK